MKLSFFGGLDFGRVGAPTLTPNGELQLASLDDLMGHKLKVLLQRVEIKDYQDIAAMLRSGVPLERGLGAASALFGRSFSPLEALRALTYFQDGEVRNLSEHDRQTIIAHVQSAKAPTPLAVVSRTLCDTTLLRPNSG